MFCTSTAAVRMLRHTFVHLPGVGAHRERKLWQQGILDGDRFLAAAESGLLPARTRATLAPLVRRSLDAVASGDVKFLQALLPQREMWRLCRAFADRALFLDIETTGLSAHYDEVTIIGALGNGKLARSAGEPPLKLTYDSECLGTWIAQELGWGGA
jgi:uncharacterized protein